MLHDEAPALYERWFQPTAAAPSGLQDPPRPYVVRTRHLEGHTFATGDPIPFRVHIFDAGAPIGTPVTISLIPPTDPVSRIRVEFLTPTELKGSNDFDFATLFARIRDRVSTLRALYGKGPLPIDFRAMGDQAAIIRKTASSLIDSSHHRTSKQTGQHHPIGGHTGWADYEGNLTTFLPYLQAATWTGVGRQTVWGKGELRTTVL